MNSETNPDPEVEINFDREEVPDSENDGVGISLPDAEEIKTDLTPRRRFPYKSIFVAICVLAIVIGITVGLNGRSVSSNSSVDNSGVKNAQGDSVDKTSDGNLLGGNDKQENSKTDKPVSDSAGDGTGFDGNGSADRYNDVVNFLKEVSTEDSLRESGSPANLACNWISNSDGLMLPIPQNITSADSDIFIQRFVSALLYFSLDGDNWMFHDDFLKGEDVCYWNRGILAEGTSYTFGLHCLEDSPLISAIFMTGNNLTGTLPSELGLLTSLTHISLFNNEISGPIPSSFESLTGLTFLAMENNNISSTIPEWIGKWSNLKYLALGSNLLQGPLPASLFTLQHLVEISVSNNDLTGNLDFFSDMEKLHRLYAAGNPFGNELNDDFLAGSRIKELDLGGTKLKGTLPSHFFSADSNFEILDLHGNEIEGALPDFEDNGRLIFLSLYDNKLSQSIPVSISNLSQLRHLDLSYNQLGGSVPEEITTLSELTYLYLSYNRFSTGNLLPVWKLSNLKELSLKKTQLTGSIPTEIGLMENLVLFNLARNQLKGKIPKTIGELSNLRYVMLNENLLTGTLTVGFTKLENVELLLLEDNDIDGGAQHVCGDTDSLRKTPTVMSADCPGEYNCTCCTLCCSNKHTCYADTDILQNIDINFDHTFSIESSYARDQFVFSENIIFRPIPVDKTRTEG